MEKLQSVIKHLADIINLIANHGIWKILEAILVIAILLSLLYPSRIVNTFGEIIREINDSKKEFRQENDPIIRSALHDAVWELDAVRASVLEFHNGKTNASGLGFYYADMSYESVKDTDYYISDQYQNINLSLLNLPDYLYKNGFWYGTVKELHDLDPKLASMIKTNGTEWIAFLLLEGSDDLGILEISFIEEPEDKQRVGREIRKLGSVVSGKLDFANSRVKKK